MNRIAKLQAHQGKQAIKKINDMIDRLNALSNFRITGGGASSRVTHNGISVALPRVTGNSQIQRSKIKTTFTTGTTVDVELVDVSDTVISGTATISAYVNEDQSSMNPTTSAPTLTAGDFKHIVKVFDDWYLVAPLIELDPSCA